MNLGPHLDAEEVLSDEEKMEVIPSEILKEGAQSKEEEKASTLEKRLGGAKVNQRETRKTK